MVWFLPILVHVIVAAALGIGTFAMLAPARASRVYGIATTHSLPFVVATGARDIFIGLMLLLVWNQQSSELLARFFFATVVVSATDAYLVFKYGSRKIALTHLIGVVAGLVLGIWILSLN